MQIWRRDNFVSPHNEEFCRLGLILFATWPLDLWATCKGLSNTKNEYNFFYHKFDLNIIFLFNNFFKRAVFFEETVKNYLGAHLTILLVRGGAISFQNSFLQFPRKILIFQKKLFNMKIFSIKFGIKKVMLIFGVRWPHLNKCSCTPPNNFFGPWESTFGPLCKYVTYINNV